MSGTWAYADPEKPPADGWYWARWARNQETLPVHVTDGYAWFRMRDCLPWDQFVKSNARQYFTDAIADPGDEWIEQEPPEIHRQWDEEKGP